MPVYLKEKDVTAELEGVKSVLIVPCRFCPAASMAVTTHEPLIALFRSFLTTPSYEQLIQDMKRGFEERGIETGVFRSQLLHQFVLCMWSSKRREALAQRAQEYDAIVVLGCETATQTVRNAVAPYNGRVVQGMTSHGVMGVKPGFRLPCDVSLELESVTHLNPPEQEKTVGGLAEKAWSLQWDIQRESRMAPKTPCADPVRLDD